MSNKIVSSAKSLIVPIIFLTMSLIKIKKSNGPKIEPCGTPALILCQVEVQLFKHTLCCLVSR